MTYRFGSASTRKLEGVHPDLVSVCHRALGYAQMDFSVVQGVRTLEEQSRLYAQGRTQPGPIVTWTMNSNHLPKRDNYGYAVDIAPYIEGRIDWDNHANFDFLATLMFRAAMEEGVRIGWGGHWQSKDRPHFELLT